MRYWMIFVGLIAVVVMAVSCDRNNAKQLQFSGTLEITDHQLGAKASGGITSLSVEEGDLVKAGQVIATLDRFEQTKKDYERAQMLFKQGGADHQSVEYAQLKMEDQEIISPIDGVVLVKVRELGEVVGAGAPVAVIGDPKDQWVKIFIPEGQINQIQMNQVATISFDGVKQTFKGHVRYIATKAEFTPRNVQTPEERVTQAFAVKVAIDENNVQAHPGVAVDVKL